MTAFGTSTPSVRPRASQRITEAAGLENFTANDLRWTAASWMTFMGVSWSVVSRILHYVAGGGSAAEDLHGYDSEKLQALARWAARLEEILHNPQR